MYSPFSQYGLASNTFANNGVYTGVCIKQNLKGFCELYMIDWIYGTLYGCMITIYLYDLFYDDAKTRNVENLELNLQ